MKPHTRRSLAEALFRTRQFLWNARDRHRHREGRSHSRFNEAQYSRATGTFFFDRGGREKNVEKYDAAFRDWKEGVFERANRVIQHRFDFLGYKDLVYGSDQQIDWHADPVNHKQSPKTWWQKVPCHDANTVGDAKVIWELNRHQHLVLLAKAFSVSGDVAYLEEFVRQLESWFQSNPPKYGINWTSSLELSYRLIAWCWAFHLFGGAKSFSGPFFDHFLYFINLQTEHIENNLSTYYSPNTHLTGEALGLFYVGLLFRGFKNADRWVEKGREILLRCADEHILPDGGYMERSLWYHRYTLDIYLHFYLLAKRNNISLPQELEDKILDLAEFLLYASTPGRRFPLIGDDDGGRLMPLDSLGGNDLKGLFSTLSVIFNRGDFKYLSKEFQEETLWLLGPESHETYDKIEGKEPSPASKGFKKTGFFFMRSGWSEDANYLAFDCGAHGWLNCGHAHADLLSLHVAAGADPIIVDPGTYSYVDDTRDLFRGAGAHSTVSIDGFHPAVPNGPFHWKEVPEHRLLKWSSDSEYDHVAGIMTGKVEWRHLRDVFFIKPDLFLVIDVVEGTGIHDIEIRFPLYGKAWEVRDTMCESEEAQRECSIECFLPEGLSLKLVDSWVSLCYGHKMPSCTLLVKGKIELPCKTSVLINLSEQPCTVEMLGDGETTGFRVKHKENNAKVFEYLGGN